MNEEKIKEMLMEKTMEEGLGVTDFKDEGVLTNDEGFTIEAEGKEYQVTIIEK